VIDEKGTEKQVVKAAVIFESIEPIMTKKGILSKRNQVKGKTTVGNCEENFWGTVNDVLGKKYDMDQVKNIYLMGDGAKWIKAGVAELKLPDIEVKYGIDKFHFKQAIERISSDKLESKILHSYCLLGYKSDFKELVKFIKESSPERVAIIEENEKYILNNWKAYQVTVKEIKIGCPMEQAISHILAAVFTSVPKAYGKDNLPTYVNNRIIHENNSDFRNLIIESMSKQRQEYPSDYDFSIFEKTTYINPTLDSIQKNIITKF
jgi:hypothetical protein